MKPDTPTSEELLYPLSEFDEQVRGAHQVEPEAVPVPYRELLVHDTDMTSTLERFFDEPMKLLVLHKRVQDDQMFRQVLLAGQQTDRVVEFGAIHIDLSLFDDNCRKLIEACSAPLGAILRDHGVAYESRPSAYLSLAAGPAIGELLGCGTEQELFGRKNTLLTPDGQAMAHIIEVLPTLAKGGAR